MKNSVKTMLILSVISLAAGLLGSGIVYRFLPRYLCYVVYDVSASDSSAHEDREIAPGAQYDEYFTPRSSYIKSIEINLNAVAKGEKAGMDGGAVTGILRDENGKVLSKKQYTVSGEDVRRQLYCEFPFETWVRTDRQYRLSLSFPEKEGIVVTFDPDGGCAEHVALWENGAETQDALYMRYVYGAYSKKLLLMWFLAFFVSAYFLGECAVGFRRGRCESEDSIIRSF
ncbi:MAG: hypothetical protein NC399_10105 [Muribaculum sp.]|nr:hypothetical protein [Muribaculum sp.]